MDTQTKHLLLLKRFIIECEWWIRGNVLCNGNFLYHTETQKTSFIASIRDRIALLQLPGISHLAGKAAATIYFIAEQRATIGYLEYELRSPLRLFSDFEAITRETDNHHNLQKPLTVKYHFDTKNEFSDEVRLNPAEIVCVLSLVKDRKRIILERKRYSDKPIEYNTYVLDTQTLPDGTNQNFDNLRNYLDPFCLHLISANNFIVNEAYYYFDGENLKLNSDLKLRVEISDFDENRFKEIILNKRNADKKTVHQDLIMCRENKRTHLNSLQNLSSFYSYHKAMLDAN